jgi:hypothetical protein
MPSRRQPASVLGSRSTNPGTRAKSRRFLVTSCSSKRSAVAATSASRVAIREVRRIRPACSATVPSMPIAVNEPSETRTMSSSTCSPAKSSHSVTTEYAIGSLPMTSRRAPRKLSTRTSVSSSRPATIPLRSRRDLQIRHRPERAVEDRLDVARRRPVEIRVESVAHDRRERDAFTLDARVDLAALLRGQVHLRSGRAHIHHTRIHVVPHLPIRRVLA